MIASSDEKPLEGRICSSCSQYQPIDCFRRLRKGSDKRRAQCGDCRRITDLARREKVDRRELAAAMAEIRRRSSADGILDFLDGVGAHFGGRDRLAKRFAELLESPSSSPHWRVKCAITLLHMATAADLHRFSQLPHEQPAKFLAIFHSNRSLFPALRELYNEGAFTLPELLDGVDPPPSGAIHEPPFDDHVAP